MLNPLVIQILEELVNVQREALAVSEGTYCTKSMFSKMDVAFPAFPALKGNVTIGQHRPAKPKTRKLIFVGWIKAFTVIGDIKESSLAAYRIGLSFTFTSLLSVPFFANLVQCWLISRKG